MGASRNEGKSPKPRNRSRSPTSSHSPCDDTFVTSTPEVGVPRCADLIFVLLQQPNRNREPLRGHPVVLGDFDDRLHPDLRLPRLVMHVNVHPQFLTGEE